MAAGEMLTMSGVSLAFGATQALDGVDLRVERGEVHALVGENGAGKSSLMKVLAGVYRPDAGTMTLQRQPFVPHEPRDALARGVAMIYQELTVLPHLTVGENVMLGREAAAWGWLRRGSMERRVTEVLALLDHSDMSLSAKVGSLGPAQRQIVEIARAMARDAKVLVMDEPTSSLGGRDVERLAGVIRRLATGGRSIVYISHFLEEVRQVCDTFTVLRDGRSVANGSVADVTNAELVRHMVGRQLEEVFPPRRLDVGEPVLEVAAVAGEPLPRDASLTLHRGEILGVGGLCGAGRTETMELLFDLRSRVRGGVRVHGAPVAAGVHARWRQGMGFVVEDRKTQGLAVDRTIAENVTLPSLHRLARGGWIDRQREQEQVQGRVDALGIKCRGPRQRVRALSGGNQQKVALARLLQADADVWLLDEPTRGIDVGSKLEIYQLLDRLAREGRAILMVSSQLPELLGMCDRIAVMRGGVLGPARPAGEWTQESLLHAALEVAES